MRSSRAWGRQVDLDRTSEQTNTQVVVMRNRETV
jgi:hypothetical protein